MLNTLTSRRSLTVAMAIVACGFIFVLPQEQDLSNFEPKPEVTFSTDVSQASDASPQQAAPTASPNVEPELNELGADLEAQAVEALKLFTAPPPETPAESTSDKR